MSKYKEPLHKLDPFNRKDILPHEKVALVLDEIITAYELWKINDYLIGKALLVVARAAHQNDRFPITLLLHNIMGMKRLWTKPQPEHVDEEVNKVIPYERAIVDMLIGDTPRKKYDHLMSMMQMLQAIAYPRRGTPEETWTIETVSELIRSMDLIRQDADYSKT